MIARLTGVLVELDDNSALVEVGGVGYQVLLPAYCTGELAGHLQEQVTLHTLYYLQLERNRAVPYLVGFPRPQDREFFEKFTTVAGVGPKMAAKALVRPIAQIAAAIDAGDVAALVALPSIGSQKAKQIIAKLQGKPSPWPDRRRARPLLPQRKRSKKPASSSPSSNFRKKKARNCCNTPFQSWVKKLPLKR